MSKPNIIPEAPPMRDNPMTDAIEVANRVLRKDDFDCEQHRADRDILARALLASREELEQEIARRQRLFEDYERTTLALVESQEDAEACRAQLREAERQRDALVDPRIEFRYRHLDYDWECRVFDEDYRMAAKYYGATKLDALRAALADAAPPPNPDHMCLKRNCPGCEEGFNTIPAAPPQEEVTHG